MSTAALKEEPKKVVQETEHKPASHGTYYGQLSPKSQWIWRGTGKPGDAWEHNPGHGPEPGEQAGVQPLAPVKPGDTLSGTTTIDQMIAALYQTNTLGTPTAYIWTDPTCITVTYSHQSVIYIRLTAKAAPGSGLKIGLT